MHIFLSDNPETVINEQLVALLTSNNSINAFAISFNINTYYLPEPSFIELIAVICLSKIHNSISGAIFQYSLQMYNAIESLSIELSAIQDLAQKHKTPWLNFSAPLTLEPIKIPKPWGQEIWYTGIEARGQSGVIAQGFTVPLPWVLALMPEYLAAGLDKKITLLKTLDPLPEEVYGDLYFELHEQKQEVYIVTHVHEKAWKNNIGAIRLGFDAAKRAEFSSDENFKAAYLDAVKAYEKIRRVIDAFIDKEREKFDIALDAPVDSATLKQWEKECPQQLMEQEQQARDFMNSFSALHPLQVGDVVKVPCYVPHALQHGVRTLEFQTPVYERKILSFAQKVLTQKHWDTAAALNKILLSMPEPEDHAVIFQSDDVTVEKIVGFADFSVIRISLSAYTTYSLPPQNSYALIMPIANSCQLFSTAMETNIAAETAIFVPHALMSNAQESVWLSAGDLAVQVLIATAEQ